MSLTDLAVRRLKPKDKPYRVSDGGGMFIEVKPNGSKYWRLAFRFAGKQKHMVFGVYPEVSLAEARKQRDQARAWLRKGKNPVVERQKQKAEKAAMVSNTFAVVAREWWESKQVEWQADNARRIWQWIEKDMLMEWSAPLLKRPQEGENDSALK